MDRSNNLSVIVLIYSVNFTSDKKIEANAILSSNGMPTSFWKYIETQMKNKYWY